MSENTSNNADLDTNLKRKKPRFEELAKARLKVDNSIRLNAFQVRPAALTYEITDNLNKLAQPRRRYSSDTYRYSSPSFLSQTPSLKPENFSRESSIMSLSKKESNGSQKPHIETYANIAARRNIRHPKRLRDFSRPMKNFPESWSGSSTNENKFIQFMNAYNPRYKR